VPLPNLSQPVFLAILGLGASGQQGANNAPALEIVGQAAPTVAPTVFYAFTPTVLGRSDRPLKYTIENKPAWASFGIRRGTLYGTPHVAHAGTYRDIRITVSDGNRSVTLPPFTITVGPPAASVPRN
jgi:hypothetical protein